MAKLRVRIKLNEGGEGAPLEQLVKVGAELERFLRYLAEDSGVSIAKYKWLAREFGNESVSFDSEGDGEFTEEQVRRFNSSLNYCLTFDPNEGLLNGAVKHKTLFQFAKIADPLGLHETIRLGVYSPHGERPQWRELSKRWATTLKDRLDDTIQYTGTVRAKLYSLKLEPPTSFQVRLVRTGDLIRCNASTDLFDHICKVATHKDGLVYIRGKITARRIDRQISSLWALDVKPVQELDDDAYEGFFGIDETYTGDLTTEEFVDEARDYE